MMDERGIKVKRTSSLWETEPMYVKDQNLFMNGACEVGTSPAVLMFGNFEPAS
jgi:2-amino-4-hydroxy-6-hydroxymethyldihydropteridine diphosphokinase/dihydropteroate synthase